MDGVGLEIWEKDRGEGVPVGSDEVALCKSRSTNSLEKIVHIYHCSYCQPQMVCHRVLPQEASQDLTPQSSTQSNS